jgi:hypothetical protein
VEVWVQAQDCARQVIGSDNPTCTSTLLSAKREQGCKSAWEVYTIVDNAAEVFISKMKTRLAYPKLSTI